MAGETVLHMSHCGTYTESSGYPGYVILMMKAEVQEPKPTRQVIAKPLLTSQHVHLPGSSKSLTKSKGGEHTMSGGREVEVYYHHGTVRNYDQSVTRPCLG